MSTHQAATLAALGVLAGIAATVAIFQLGIVGLALFMAGAVVGLMR